MIVKEVLENLVLEILTLLFKKNTDYGDSYFNLRNEFGKITFIVRLCDKTNRLKTLFKQNTQVFNDEREEDTIKDIIGYCLLELYYRYIFKSTEELKKNS